MVFVGVFSIKVGLDDDMAYFNEICEIISIGDGFVEECNLESGQKGQCQSQAMVMLVRRD